MCSKIYYQKYRKLKKNKVNKLKIKVNKLENGKFYTEILKCNM